MGSGGRGSGGRGAGTYHELGALRILLRHLLGLHGGGVVPAERQLRDRHIVQDNVEVLRALGEDAPDVAADHLDAQVVHCSGGDPT